MQAFVAAGMLIQRLVHGLSLSRSSTVKMIARQRCDVHQTSAKDDDGPRCTERLEVEISTVKQRIELHGLPLSRRHGSGRGAAALGVR